MGATAPSDPGPPQQPSPLRAAGSALLAAALGGAALLLWPQLETAVFARGAATLAGLWLATPVVPDSGNWLLPTTNPPLAVTTACSGADYFLIVAALLGWSAVRRGWRTGLAVTGGLVGALPLAILVNSLRIVVLAQVHGRILPHLPQAYGPWLHLTTGVAIFLPALIALHLILEYHARRRSRPAS